MNHIEEQVRRLYEMLSPCRLCPHRCGVDRLKGEKGRCRSGTEIFISSSNLHFGEEPPISGSNGSGTIFMTNCNLACVFCQNYPISQFGNGNPITADALAGTMLELQKRGAHNINFVTPTLMMAQVADAIVRARKSGLTVPTVYNSGGYEDVEAVRLLDGIIDIYLPDAKYGDDACAEKYSGARNYRENNRNVLKEMYRQVGNLVCDQNGVARRGMIIRHLVLPDAIAGSSAVLEFIAREISPEMHVGLMSQYHPAHKSNLYPELTRRLTGREYDEVLNLVCDLGLENGWQQEL